jgi:hypothetical protein
MADKFSDKSRIYIDYGRKISELSKQFKTDKISFFKMLRDKIEKEEIGVYKQENKEKGNKGLRVKLDLNLNNKLFSNEKPTLIGFTGRDGVSSKDEDDGEEDESNSLRPSTDFFIKIPITKKMKKEVSNNDYETKILFKYKDVLYQEDTKRKGKFFVIMFNKKLLSQSFEQMTNEIVDVLKHTIKILNEEE